jgi:hypothetical protein
MFRRFEVMECVANVEWRFRGEGYSAFREVESTAFRHGEGVHHGAGEVTFHCVEEWCGESLGYR